MPTIMIPLGILAIATGVAALGPAPVNLGTAVNYVILAESGISCSPQCHITGNIGLSPASGIALTGCALTLDPTGAFSTSSQVTGEVFAASYSSPTPATLLVAIEDMQRAYTDAAGRTTPDFTNLNSGAIGGLVLTPGLYKFTSAVSIGSDVTVSGATTDTWIFQVSGTLSLAAGHKVLLANGALAKNIVWVIAGATTFQAGSHFEGILLAKTSVTLNTGSTMIGRILSQTSVALQDATVTAPT